MPNGDRCYGGEKMQGKDNRKTGQGGGRLVIAHKVMEEGFLSDV